jgi:hypothetical protein
LVKKPGHFLLLLAATGGGIFFGSSAFFLFYGNLVLLKQSLFPSLAFRARAEPTTTARLLN